MLASLKNMSKNDKKSHGTRYKSSDGAEMKHEYTEGDIPYNYLTFREVRNIVDLLNLYITVNQQVIQLGESDIEKRVSPNF